MDKNAHIILISVNNHNAREYANILRGNEIFVNDKDKTGEFVHTKFLNTFTDLKYDDVQVYTLNDFAELNNNEEYFAEDWFMTYVFTVSPL